MVRFKFYGAKPCVQFHYPTAISGHVWREYSNYSCTSIFATNVISFQYIKKTNPAREVDTYNYNYLQCYSSQN